MANLRRTEVGLPQAPAARTSQLFHGSGIDPGSLGDDGSTQVARQAADLFGQVSRQVGALADRAAAKEGELAGLKAGQSGDFRPGHAGTIYGEAWDRAGIETYRSRLATDLSTRLEAIGEKHKDSPAALAKALQALHDGYGGQLFDEVRPDFEAMFQRQSLGLMREASRAHEARVRADQAAALETEIATRTRTIQQQAYRLGLDPTADKVLGAEVAELGRRLKVTGPDGQPLLAPAAAARHMLDVTESVAVTRLKGAFGALPTAAEKQRFLDGLATQYKAGDNPLLNQLDPDRFEGLMGNLASDLRSQQTAGQAGLRGLVSEIKSLADMAEQGYSPPDTAWQDLEGRVASSGSVELMDRLAEARRLLVVTRGAAQTPPAALEAQIAAGEQEAQGNASEDLVARLSAAKAVLGKMRSELKTDPLGWAGRAGLVSVPPLDLGGQNAVGALRQRAALAEQVASHYGIEPQYFRPEETRAIAKLAGAGGQQTLAVARTLVEALGPRSPAALAELVKDAPIAAQLGGLVIDGASPATLSDAADGLLLRRADGFKPLAPAIGEARQQASGILGDAYGLVPGAEQDVIETASAIYEVRARRLGRVDFDPGLYQQAVAEAAGQVEIGGVAYGGIVAYGWGHQVVVPADLRQDRFDDAVADLTDADLAANPPRDAAGAVLPASALRSAQLVSVGDGRYRAALGDLESDPQWLAAPPGSASPYWELDLKSLSKALRQRHPDWFR